jgi:hypothetical protein
VDTNLTRDTTGWEALNGTSINGQTSYNISYDGVTNKDTGQNNANYAAPTLESIAEMRVQASNFAAEYGRASGATVLVVTKSGSQEFHGSAAYYKRDAAFNTNPIERKRQCAAGTLASCSKPPYDYDNVVYTLGGPLPLPGNLNRNRDKVFFFFSQEILPRTDPGTLQRSNMPTEAERNGDFSQTRFNTAGQARFIRNPFAANPTCTFNGGGAGCFANNVIPSGMIDPFGRAMMNLLPLPNAVDPSGNREYNYVYQTAKKKLRFENVGKIDVNIRPGTTFYTRLQLGHEVNDRGYSATLGAGVNWPQFSTSYTVDTVSTVSTLLHTFGPSTFAEFTFGANFAHQDVEPWEKDPLLDRPFLAGLGQLEANQRDVVLPGLVQFFPQANPLNLIPNVGVGNTNNLGSVRGISQDNRFPFDARNDIYNISTNITHMRGAHVWKMGAFFEYTRRPAPRAATYNGNYNFGVDTQNPLDSNFSWANMLLGVVNTYTESSGKPFANGRYRQLEGFIQDNWRVNNRLTLDLGMRFYYIGPTYVAGQQVSSFHPDQWDASRAPLLFEAACAAASPCSAGNLRARNPQTGQLVSSTFIGRLVTDPSRDPANGMVVAEGTTLDGAVKVAPRLNFAWNVFGNNKTAIRGGYGVSFDRYSDDFILSLIEQPPLLDTQQATYTTIQALQDQGGAGVPLTGSVRNVAAFAPFTPPTVHSWSLGVQQELWWRVFGDVAYVGNANRHNGVNVNINRTGYGVSNLPENRDPTSQNGSPLRDDFLRPLRGFGTINERRWIGRADYHSIQVAGNKTAAGLSLRFAYTGSLRKNQGTFDEFLDEIGFDDRQRNYTRNGSRPHIWTLQYVYELPNASSIWNNGVVRAVLDGWQIGGLTEYRGGTRDGFDFGFTGAPTGLTGAVGGVGMRVTLLCDPILPDSERTPARQFRTECVAPPGPWSDPSDVHYLGTSTDDEFVGRAFMVNDLTVSKRFRLAEGRSVQFRAEAYNVFNPVNLTGVDTSAQFNYTALNNARLADPNFRVTPENVGQFQTDVNFGTIPATGTRNNSNRVVQLALRFEF